jgi:hypothetical protein
MDHLEQILNKQVAGPCHNEFTKPVSDAMTEGVFFAVTDSVRIPVADYTFITKTFLKHSLIDWHDNMMK